MDNLTFNDLNIKSSVLKAINDMGFEEPSQIQSQAIPVILEGYDLIGSSQTGTGKTAAFGAGFLSMINNENKGIKVLVLTPTRELAIQVEEELSRLSKYEHFSLLPIYGGQPIERQIRALKRGIDIIVGTPGRILDHLKRNTLDLSNIDFLVIDEADEMLDMGFIDDIESIIKQCNEKRQTMLFSATMPTQIRKLAKKYMKKDAKFVSIAKKTMTASTVSQYYYEVKQRDRFEVLSRILDFDDPESAIIFCNTKRKVDEIVSSLKNRGYNAEGMHGDISQNQRLATLKNFKEKNLDFLVATDVAARGIDVDDVTQVINYDFPQDTETYVHRIGRTGRANKEGTAYTLVTTREYSILKQIEKATKCKIKRKEIPTVDDIFESKYKNILKKVEDELQKEDYKKYVHLATELDEEYNMVDVSAVLLKMLFEKELNLNYKDNNLSSNDFVRVFLSVGKKDKINPRTLLDFVRLNSGVKGDDIGDITLLEKFSFMDIKDSRVNTLIAKASGKKLNGRKVNIEIANKKN